MVQRHRPNVREFLGSLSADLFGGQGFGATREQEYEVFLERLKACNDCSLREGATQEVPGSGSLEAPLMMVGEAPGAEEDRCGVPFSGPAGHLLDRSLSKVGVRRSSIYITNVVRYRPPENRMPRTGEIATCVSHLLTEIRIIRPRIIAALGAVAAQTLLGTKDSLRSLRGRYVEIGESRIFPMVHPADALLNLDRDPGVLAMFEADLRRVCADVGLPASGGRPPSGS